MTPSLPIRGLHWVRTITIFFHARLQGKEVLFILDKRFCCKDHILVNLTYKAEIVKTRSDSFQVVNTSDRGVIRLDGCPFGQLLRCVNGCRIFCKISYKEEYGEEDPQYNEFIVEATLAYPVVDTLEASTA